MSRVGEKIKNIRTNVGMTQKTLGKKLGVSESFINEVENGKRVINQALIDRISKVLGQDINDIGMSFEEEVYRDEASSKVPQEMKRGKETPSASSDVWNDALSSVLKSVPVYKNNLRDIAVTRSLPVIANKIEGYAPDKVFFIQIENDDMLGFRIAKGDIAFAHTTHEIENNAICLMEHEDEMVVRQIKRLDSNKLLLISNGGSLRTETVEAKDIKIFARLDRVEIKL